MSTSLRYDFFYLFNIFKHMRCLFTQIKQSLLFICLFNINFNNTNSFLRSLAFLSSSALSLTLIVNTSYLILVKASAALADD